MASRPRPACAAGDEPYIFVTYSHDDDKLVLPEIRWLQDHGFKVWWDEGISPGAVWRAEIAEAIRRSSLLLYFVTPHSVVSEHCTREVNFALDEHRRPVLAVHLADTQLPGALALSLSDRQAILRHALGVDDYEHKLVSAIATYLDQPLPKVSTLGSRRAARRRPSWQVALASALLGAAIAAGLSWVANRPPPQPLRPISKFALALPTGVTLDSGSTSKPLSMSSDGRLVAFSGRRVDGSGLFVRRMDALETTAIEMSTTVIYTTHVSPDGGSVIFLEGSDQPVFKKIASSGGPVVSLKGAVGTELSWSRDGTIVYSEGILPGSRLMKITEFGASIQPVTQVDRGDAHTNPYLFDGGKSVVFNIIPSNHMGTVPRIVAQSLETGVQKPLGDGFAPRVTASGHLLFGRDNAIWAAPLDTERLELVAEPVVVLEDVEFTIMRSPIFDVADVGSMVYLPAAVHDASQTQALGWRNLDGSDPMLRMQADLYAEPRISPDMSRVALRRGRDSQLWVLTLDTNVFSKLSDDSVFSIAWHPDGERIAYTPIREAANLYLRNADGTGPEQRLTRSTRNQWASAWSPEGTVLLYTECDGAYRQACDIGRVRVDGEHAAELILATHANEQHPALSHDGRWIVYESDESGRFEIYVRPYPDIDRGRWQISTAGGKQPIWSRSGDALFYAEGPAMGRRMMSVEIRSQDGFAAGEPLPLFEFSNSGYEQLRNYDLDADGRRFLIATPAMANRNNQHLIYVLNWLDELERLVPTKGHRQ